MNAHHLRRLLLAVFVLPSLALHAAQTDIAGPAGSRRFGESITVLPSGNFVVTDSQCDNGGTANTGAVHLYSPTGTLISTLKGSTAGDQISSGGIVFLPSGNVLVRSPLWHNGANANAGAVTFINGSTGLAGVVSASNSVVGVSANDNVGGTAVTVLKNGNYVIITTAWNNGGVVDAGAVTWGSGTSGVVGVISPATNSLVGTNTNDNVGGFGITEVGNGNYVVRSAQWRNGSATTAGAVTWCNGLTGRIGVVSSANSLVGSTTNDQVGASGVAVLSNGNYVVRAPFWDNGGNADAGAAIWGDGNAGVTGAISSSNALVGSVPGVEISSGGVQALNGGNYVVISPLWTFGVITHVGAVTWGNGLTGSAGSVLSTNSMIGQVAEDQIGSSGVIVLSNGNYVIRSPLWDNGALADVGALTWCDGSAPAVGTVGLSNSMVGAAANDSVGSGSALPLANGYYVIASPLVDFGGKIDVGAVTWRRGDFSSAGNIAPTNSLVGSNAGDQVGSGGVLQLANGNFVVRSPLWINATNAGAITWGSQAAGLPIGPVSAANSLVGRSSDILGSNGITILANGNYVVSSQIWRNGSATNAGAVTWGNGNTGVVGLVSAENSLVGSSANDLVGNVTTLPNSNYAVATPGWDNGAVVDAGAVVWADGTKGITGPVSATNALVGSTTGDQVGLDGLFGVSGNTYGVRSRHWSNAGIADAGAVSLSNGLVPLTGPVTVANSIVGSSTGDNVGFNSTPHASGNSFIVPSPNWNNGTTAHSGAATFFAEGLPHVTGPLTSANSVLGTAANGGSSFSVTLNGPRQIFIVGRPADNKVSLVTTGPGKIAIDGTLFTVKEEDGVVKIPLVRTGGSVGSLSVNFSTSTSGATATANADYTPITNQVINFADGVASVDVPVTILNGNALNEANEIFKVIITGVAGTLGPVTTATVRIVDTGDITNPSTPVISAPAANARIGVNPGATINITGTAVDNKGIGSVEVRLNGGTFKPATLTSVAGTSASWSIALAPATGANLIEVRSTDTRGNVSPVFGARSFVCTRPLTIVSSGALGKFTTGFAPSSFREVGKLCAVTATAPAGFIFVRWDVTGGFTAADVGLSDAQLQLPAITFSFKESLVLTAVFAANPYLITGVAGTYNGIIHADPLLPDREPAGAGPEDGTLVSNSTEGSISIALLTTGSFTGKLNIDGFSLPIAGVCDDIGNARFGPSRASVLSVPRTGKSALILALNVALPIGLLHGTVVDLDVAQSTISGDRAFYNGTTLIPTAFLGASNANGLFNFAYQPRIAAGQPGGLQLADFPQGYGFGTATVTKTGAISFAGVLPEGTSFTAAGTLSQLNLWHLFASLYKGHGFLNSDVQFLIGNANNDLFASTLNWVRPPLDDQYYPAGWPGGLYLNGFGTRIVVPVGASDVIGVTLPPFDADGNATLEFFDGGISGFVFKTVGIAPTDVVTNLPADTSFKLTITRSTAHFSGTFTHQNGTKPAFQGIFLQRATAGFSGVGYFKTVAPAVKDYTGQGGVIQILKQ